MTVFQKAVQKIAIVIPAHNEQDHIGDCLTAIQTAIHHLKQTFSQIAVDVIVVLDSCSDNTQAIVEGFGVDYLTCEFKNVGKVRALGIHHAMAQGADWIACSDADSQVAENWLTAQLQHLQDDTCDMICGVVAVDSWDNLSEKVKTDYLAHYQDRMNHRHIHGANLSFSVYAYRQVSGFTDLPCHEDVDLVRKFEQQHFNIVWSNKVRVTTSSRLEARASEGFAHFLSNLCISHQT